MTSLHELKTMVDALVDQVHGSPVADKPIRFQGRPVDIRLFPNMEKNQVMISITEDEAPSSVIPPNAN